MLNISEHSISEEVSLEDFKSYKLLQKSKIRRLSLLLGVGSVIVILCCLFLPWTQNVNARGYVTTRSPEQRPQAIQSVIAGRINEWYVKEGDLVNKGDTIVYITETKSEYFDPELLDRTAEQLQAKSQSIQSYDQKVVELKKQYAALQETLLLKEEQTRNKIEQAKNKIKIDSIDLVAFEVNLSIANNQYKRINDLYDKGLKTLTELQEKEYKAQAEKAKVNVQKNKLINQKNALINLKIELNAIARDYDDKLAKSRSEQQTAYAARLESVAHTSKLKNQLRNYTERQQFYYILAPQTGYITKTIKKGIGETLKEGTDIATIMPAEYDLAIETYVKPQDLPLLNIGQRVRLRFDGWPAIVISGWPESSTGVFTGDISAIDQYISENGYYRILVSPNTEEKIWPENLRVGTGAHSYILLNDVPIWYEIWRQLNGFPPDFYVKKQAKGYEIKRKAPIKSVK